MLFEWMRILFREIKDYYDLYAMVLLISIGLFSLFAEAKSLERKKLRKEVKICRFFGAVYVIGGVGLFVIVTLFG